MLGIPLLLHVSLEALQTLVRSEHMEPWSNGALLSSTAALLCLQPCFGVSEPCLGTSLSQQPESFCSDTGHAVTAPNPAPHPAWPCTAQRCQRAQEAPGNISAASSCQGAVNLGSSHAVEATKSLVKVLSPHTTRDILTFAIQMGGGHTPQLF